MKRSFSGGMAAMYFGILAIVVVSLVSFNAQGSGTTCTWQWWEYSGWNAINYGCGALGCDPPSEPGEENGQIETTSCNN